MNNAPTKFEKEIKVIRQELSELVNLLAKNEFKFPPTDSLRDGKKHVISGQNREAKYARKLADIANAIESVKSACVVALSNRDKADRSKNSAINAMAKRFGLSQQAIMEFIASKGGEI